MSRPPTPSPCSSTPPSLGDSSIPPFTPPFVSVDLVLLDAISHTALKQALCALGQSSSGNKLTLLPRLLLALQSLPRPSLSPEGAWDFPFESLKVPSSSSSTTSSSSSTLSSTMFALVEDGELPPSVRLSSMNFPLALNRPLALPPSSLALLPTPPQIQLRPPMPSSSTSSFHLPTLLLPRHLSHYLLRLIPILPSRRSFLWFRYQVSTSFYSRSIQGFTGASCGSPPPAIPPPAAPLASSSSSSTLLLRVARYLTSVNTSMMSRCLVPFFSHLGPWFFYLSRWIFPTPVCQAWSSDLHSYMVLSLSYSVSAFGLFCTLPGLIMGRSLPPTAPAGMFAHVLRDHLAEHGAALLNPIGIPPGSSFSSPKALSSKLLALHSHMQSMSTSHGLPDDLVNALPLHDHPTGPLLCLGP
ncbi:hypothetical protein BC829DRAFT_449493 [Chytridium lagenaria]|nr:hypothetical protein BC829DRAFT_449493 [Chytridium lagenaria]